MHDLEFASPEQVREDFDRIATAGPSAGGDHSEPVVDALLARLPGRFDHAIDLGCGSGSLLGRLAPRARRVTGIDLSPAMLAVARTRVAGFANVDLLAADFRTAPLPAAAFDLVISVATFHHLPLAAALERAASLVAPGGWLVVVDLYTPAGLGGFLENARSWILARRRARGRPRPSPELRAAWRAHETHDRHPGLAEIRSAARGFPGATLAVHRLWRWSLVWEKPR